MKASARLSRIEESVTTMLSFWCRIKRRWRWRTSMRAAQLTSHAPAAGLYLLHCFYDHTVFLCRHRRASMNNVYLLLHGSLHGPTLVQFAGPNPRSWQPNPTFSEQTRPDPSKQNTHIATLPIRPRSQTSVQCIFNFVKYKTDNVAKRATDTA